MADNLDQMLLDGDVDDSIFPDEVDFLSEGDEDFFPLDEFEELGG